MRKQFAVAFFQALAVCLVILGPIGFPLDGRPLYGLILLSQFVGIGAVIFLLTLVLSKNLTFEHIGVGRIIAIALITIAAIVYTVVGLLLYETSEAIGVMGIISAPVALVLSAAYALLRTAGFKKDPAAPGNVPTDPTIKN